jgi:hypothetical protein
MKIPELRVYKKSAKKDKARNPRNIVFTSLAAKMA